MRRPEINGFIAVSPPANKYDFNFLSPCPAHGLIVQGTKDDIVNEADVYTLYERLDKLRNSRDSRIEYAPINGANHFFTDHLEELSSAVNNFVEARATTEAAPRKLKRDRRRRQLVNQS